MRCVPSPRGARPAFLLRVAVSCAIAGCASDNHSASSPVPDAAAGQFAPDATEEATTGDDAEPEAAPDSFQCIAPLDVCSDASECCEAMSCDFVGSMLNKTCCFGLHDPCGAEPSGCCGDMMCVGDPGTETCLACGRAGHDCTVPAECCPGFQCNAQGTCEAI